MKKIGRYFMQCDTSIEETNGFGHGQQVSSGRDACNSEVPIPQVVQGCHMDQELNVITPSCERKMITNVNSCRLCFRQEYSS